MHWGVPMCLARGNANLPAYHGCSQVSNSCFLFFACMLLTEASCLKSTFAASLTCPSPCGSSVRAAHLVGFQLVCKVLHLLLVLEELVCKHTELGHSLLLPDIRLQHATVQHLFVALQQPTCKISQMIDGRAMQFMWCRQQQGTWLSLNWALDLLLSPGCVASCKVVQPAMTHRSATSPGQHAEGSNRLWGGAVQMVREGIRVVILWER